MLVFGLQWFSEYQFPVSITKPSSFKAACNFLYGFIKLSCSSESKNNMDNSRFIYVLKMFVS